MKRHVALFFAAVACVCGSLSATSSTSATESAKYEFTGTHFMASYKGCDHEALTNLPRLKEALTNAAKASGATILDKVDYTFQPDGLTMVILLSESHMSAHTYPEFDAVFVDLFTCGHNCSAKAFDEALRAYLKPTKVTKGLLERD